MTEPLIVPIPPHMQTRFAQMRADAQKLETRQNEAVTTLIATVHDPLLVQGWQIALGTTEIVCTPPPEGSESSEHA